MASLKKCVDEKCKQCTYDPSSPGSWRQQTENCTVTSCPLWEVRPVTMESGHQRRKAKSADDARIDALLDSLEDE